MDLFDRSGCPHNLLKQDGVVQYYGPIMSHEQADYYFADLLKHVAWQHDRAIIYGETIITKRKVAWYADQPFSYTYAKISRQAKPWLPVLLKLKDLVETKSSEKFNSCLLNLYHDGSEGMSWHSDSEGELKPHGAIGSLSLGAIRKFLLRHKRTRHSATQLLEHGSLLVMKGTTQTNWLHCLPPTKRVLTPRINLTFRSVVENTSSN